MAGGYYNYRTINLAIREKKMNTLGIINTSLVPATEYVPAGTVSIGGTEIPLGVFDIPQPTFSERDPANSGFVQVQVKSFSCNYRDKAIILKSSLNQKRAKTSAPVAFFGSDFVAVVTAVGPDVTTLKCGDRVIPDCAFPTPPAPGVAPGVTTNEASRGWLRLHSSKVTKIPDDIEDNIAASFSIGGQTSRSLIRKTVRDSSDRALVMSARSNTSVFVLSALSAKGIDTTAVTTSEWTAEEKSFFPNVQFVHLKEKTVLESLPAKSFDALIDPFFDIHLPDVLSLLSPGARYITCGYKNQHESFDTDGTGRSWKIDRADMLNIMINNISLIGNCIGTKEDLADAIADFVVKKQRLPVDSVFECWKGGDFLDRTYNQRGRLGKAVLRLS